jgi:CRISPR-associated protein Csm1
MNRLDESCVVAFAALIPDLDIFARRAKGNASARDGQQKPPGNQAAGTARVLEELEGKLPQPFTDGVFPPARGNGVPAADPVEAAPSGPETFLQGVVAAADRLAAGFAQEAPAKDKPGGGKDGGRDSVRARLPSLFERLLRGDSRPGESRSGPPPPGKPGSENGRYRYPLQALSAGGIFPLPREQCEPEADEAARAEYACLWTQFVQGLDEIPASYRSNPPLWLDAFDSLWQAVAHAVPAAAASGARADVSLYDQGKTRAALAVALRRYHRAGDGNGPEDIPDERAREAGDEKKFLLIQGDFFGIQDFIFAEGGESNKQAAKILRGRSFQVSLFTELAALRILESLELPPTSQIVNAAGKFLIVAHNTDEAREKLRAVRRELDDWFLSRAFGLAGIGLAWDAACGGDFCGSAGESPFASLQQRLFERLEDAKLRRYDVCRRSTPVLNADFSRGTCAWQSRLPADREGTDDEPASCALSRDQKLIGDCLVKHSRILALREDAASGLSGVLCEMPVFGYRLLFVGEKAARDFSPPADPGALRRCWDFSLPQGMDDILWNGHARRHINGYVPRFSAREAAGPKQEKYGEVLAGEVQENALKSFGHLACEDRAEKDGGRWQGQVALLALKGDVDDLGLIFQKGLHDPESGRGATLAGMAALSRRMNAFFAVYLPVLCAREYPDTYTVFAGGDDFFLIGPWRSTQRLAAGLAEEFFRYAAQNPKIHFSAGMAMIRPDSPVQVLAEEAEEALAEAKNAAEKNSFSLYGAVDLWRRWPELESVLGEMEKRKEAYSLSSGFFYALLTLLDQELALQGGNLEAGLWRSRLAYRAARTVEAWRLPDRSRPEPEERKQARQDIVQTFGANGIAQYGRAFRIPLFNHLYRQR